MKNTALIDANIIMDWLLKRKPFHISSDEIIALCLSEKVQGYLACHTILNLFYLLRKKHSVTARREILLMLCANFKVIDITEKMLVTVLNDDSQNDIEDAMQLQCAIDKNVDYIITRDADGFIHSKFKTLTPEAFLALRHVGKL